MSMQFPNEEPLARSEDESTSHGAAELLTESGKRDSSKFEVWGWMIANGYDDQPDSKKSRTARELAALSGIPHPTMHKRLPDLLRDGWVEKCEKRICERSGIRCVTWRAKLNPNQQPEPEDDIEDDAETPSTLFEL